MLLPKYLKTECRTKRALPGRNSFFLSLWCFRLGHLHRQIDLLFPDPDDDPLSLTALNGTGGGKRIVRQGAARSLVESGCTLGGPPPVGERTPLPQFPGARTSVCTAPIHTRCRTCWGSPVAMQSPISASMPHFLAKDRSSWLLITYWRGPSAVRGTNQSLQQDRNTPRTPQHAPVERSWKDTRNAGSKRRRRAKLAQKRIKT
ncbi:hypothetical protein J6590_107588, partial [Homalodisca vitripennis]